MHAVRVAHSLRSAALVADYNEPLTEEAVLTQAAGAATYLHLPNASKSTRDTTRLLVAGTLQLQERCSAQQVELADLRKQVASLEKRAAAESERAAESEARYAELQRRTGDTQGLGVEAQVQLLLDQHAAAQRKQLSELQHQMQKQQGQLQALLDTHTAAVGAAAPHPVAAPTQAQPAAQAAGGDLDGWTQVRRRRAGSYQSAVRTGATEHTGAHAAAAAAAPARAVAAPAAPLARGQRRPHGTADRVRLRVMVQRAPAAGADGPAPPVRSLPVNDSAAERIAAELLQGLGLEPDDVLHGAFLQRGRAPAGQPEPIHALVLTLTKAGAGDVLRHARQGAASLAGWHIAKHLGSQEYKNRLALRAHCAQELSNAPAGARVQFFNGSRSVRIDGVVHHLPAPATVEQHTEDT